MGHLWKHALPRSKLLYLLLVTEVEKQGAEIGWDFGTFCVEGNKLKIYSILLKLSTLFIILSIIISIVHPSSAIQKIGYITCFLLIPIFLYLRSKAKRIPKNEDPPWDID